MSALALSLLLMGGLPSEGVVHRDLALRSYFDCAVSRRASEMAAMLAATNEEDFVAAAKHTTDVDRCVSGNDEQAAAPLVGAVGAMRGTVRGMIAEALLRRAPVRSLAALPVTPKVTARTWFWTTGRERPIDEMAVCVADSNPAGIQAVLATQPGSRGQNEALKALAPSLGACLAKGYQLNTGPTGLRAALAEAYYHRVSDAPPSGGKVAN